MGDQAEKKPHKKKKTEEKKERPPLLETDQIIAGDTGNRYLVESMLGKGGFGEVYKVSTLADPEKKFAMKVESNHSDVHKNMLRLKVEIHVFDSIKKAEAGYHVDKSHFVNMHDKGRTEGFKYYVMDLIMMSLKDAVEKLCKGVLSSHAKIIIARQTLKSLDTLHELGFLHRDIKWHNFAVGLPPKDNIIYCLDFGIARPYREADGRVMIARANVPFMGTHRYASIRAMSCLEQCRKDDLESWLYMMLEIYDKNNLYWRNYKSNDPDWPKWVLQCKMDVMTKPKHLLASGNLKMPKQYCKMIEWINKMTYTDPGDFVFFDMVLNAIAKAEKIDEKLPLDWIGKKLPEEPKKEVTNKTKKVKHKKEQKISRQTEDEDKETMDDRLNKREKGRKRGKKARDAEDEYFRSDSDDSEDDDYSDEDSEEEEERRRRRRRAHRRRTRDYSDRDGDDRRRRRRSSGGRRRHRVRETQEVSREEEPRRRKMSKEYAMHEDGPRRRRDKNRASYEDRDIPRIPDDIPSAEVVEKEQKKPKEEKEVKEKRDEKKDKAEVKKEEKTPEKPSPSKEKGAETPDDGAHIALGQAKSKEKVNDVKDKKAKDEKKKEGEGKTKEQKESPLPKVPSPESAKKKKEVAKKEPAESKKK